MGRGGVKRVAERDKAETKGRTGGTNGKRFNCFLSGLKVGKGGGV